VRRLRPGLLAALVIAAFAGPAAATSASGAEARAVAEARAWQGRWCPPAGCGAAPPASIASLGSFAAAALGALALARRRSS
jgi:hypothetical protein